MADKCPHGQEGLCEQCLREKVSESVEKEIQKEQAGEEGRN